MDIDQTEGGLRELGKSLLQSVDAGCCLSEAVRDAPALGGGPSHHDWTAGVVRLWRPTPSLQSKWGGWVRPCGADLPLVQGLDCVHSGDSSGKK